MSPSAGSLNHIQRARGTPARLPSTLNAEPSASASCDRSADTVSSGAVIAPPFSSKASAAMLSPSASTSPACTTYMNTRRDGVFVNGHTYVACRVESPISSATRGRPPVVSTATSRSNCTAKYNSSPRVYVLSLDGCG